jgi:hypothetical protein
MSKYTVRLTLGIQGHHCMFFVPAFPSHACLMMMNQSWFMQNSMTYAYLCTSTQYMWMKQGYVTGINACMQVHVWIQTVYTPRLLHSHSVKELATVQTKVKATFQHTHTHTRRVHMHNTSMSYQIKYADVHACQIWGMQHDDEWVMVLMLKGSELHELCISWHLYCLTHTPTWHIHVIHSVCCWHRYASVNAYSLTGMPHNDESVFVWSWKAQNSMSCASLGTCTAWHTHLHGTM